MPQESHSFDTLNQHAQTPEGVNDTLNQHAQTPEGVNDVYFVMVQIMMQVFCVMLQTKIKTMPETPLSVQPQNHSLVTY